MERLLMLLVSLILISACTQPSNDVVSDCIKLCQQSSNLSSGPCLSNEGDVVCDVAHEPRMAVDDLPENQCPAFGKTASHFVEVDENCNLIRKV